MGIGERGAGSKERGERQGGNLKLETECDEGAWARSGGEAGVGVKSGWWREEERAGDSRQWPVAGRQWTDDGDPVCLKPYSVLNDIHDCS